MTGGLLITLQNAALRPDTGPSLSKFKSENQGALLLLTCHHGNGHKRVIHTTNHSGYFWLQFPNKHDSSKKTQQCWSCTWIYNAFACRHVCSVVVAICVSLPQATLVSLEKRSEWDVGVLHSSCYHAYSDCWRRAGHSINCCQVGGGKELL